MKNPINAFLDSFLIVFKHLFKKPITLEYPEIKPNLPSTFRGKPIVKGCVGCGICKKVCPAGAITFHKTFEGTVTSYSFNLKKCIFCGNCAFYCPHNAITMTKEYELASINDENLKLKYQGGNND